MQSSELYHHGIKGQTWGVRNGPPYPLKGGRFQAPKKKRFSKFFEKRKHGANSKWSKKHVDKEIEGGTELQTLSRDADRFNGADMFFANYDKLDKARFMNQFNRPIYEKVLDENGKKVRVDRLYKFNIKTIAKSDIKVASEDSKLEAFKRLYSKDRDFYNYCTDPERLASILSRGDPKYKENLKYDPYKTAIKTIKKINKSNGEYIPTDKQMRAISELFSQTLPFDGGGDKRIAGDIYRQRNKLFKELKNDGYGAMLDTYDAIYHPWKSNAPVVVFDMEQIIPKQVYRTTAKEARQAYFDWKKEQLKGIIPRKKET